MNTLEIQTILAALGFEPGPLDGKPGDKTTAAVVAFQHAHSLVPDGKVGPKTSAALEAAYAARTGGAVVTTFVFPTYAELKKLFPRAKQENLEPFLAAIVRVAPVEKMDTVLRLGHFIAQCGWECDGFKTYEEYASGDAYEGRVTGLGNTQPGDGRRFKGRGPIQLTGRANYAAATPFVRKLLGMPDLDLTQNPELVASNKAIGVATSLWFWLNMGLNDWADKDNAKAVGRGINRGNPRSNKEANHEAERLAITAKVIALLTKIQKPSA